MIGGISQTSMLQPAIPVVSRTPVSPVSPASPAPVGPIQSVPENEDVRAPAPLATQASLSVESLLAAQLVQPVLPVPPQEIPEADEALQDEEVAQDALLLDDPAEERNDSRRDAVEQDPFAAELPQEAQGPAVQSAPEQVAAHEEAVREEDVRVERVEEDIQQQRTASEGAGYGTSVETQSQTLSDSSSASLYLQATHAYSQQDTARQSIDRSDSRATQAYKSLDRQVDFAA